MSCCISSAICCTLFTASMSGIALGYNYSLAEYIDLKETNVSVYLKRGVFDDEVADDMDWRRAGRMPVAGLLKDDNLMTAPPNEGDNALRSGRRLDDSIVESSDHNRFEGSLMKLTAMAPDPSTSTEELPDQKSKLGEIYSEFKDDVGRFKAIQSEINKQKTKVLSALRRAGNVDFDKKPTEPEHIDRRLLSNPLEPGPAPYLGQALPENPGRRMMIEGPTREAVDNVDVWDRPQIFRESFSTPPRIISIMPVDQRLGIPVTPIGPVRPTRVRSGPGRTHWQDRNPYRRNENMPPKFRANGSKGAAENEEEYDDVKGIPVRKKRNINVDLSKSIEDNILKLNPILSREKENEEPRIFEKGQQSASNLLEQRNRDSARRMNYVPDTNWKRISLNPLRYAVPDTEVGRPDAWSLPRRTPPEIDIRHSLDPFEFELLNLKLPTAVIPEQPIKPIRVTEGPLTTPKMRKLTSTTTEEPLLPKSIDEDLDKDLLRQKLLISKLNKVPEIKKDVMKKTEEDYDEEDKGLPVRRKRSVDIVLKRVQMSENPGSITPAAKENGVRGTNISERTFVNKLFAMFGKGIFVNSNEMFDTKKIETFCTETIKYESTDLSQRILNEKLTKDKFLIAVQSSLIT